MSSPPKLVQLLNAHTIGFTDVSGAGQRLLGSGTLVEIDGQPGMLTTEAVSKRLPTSGRLGLVLRMGLNQISIPVQDVMLPCDLPRSVSAHDTRLSFIPMRPAAYARIAREKRFFSLTPDQDALPVATTDPVVNGLATGFVNEISIIRFPLDCYDVARSFTEFGAVQVGSGTEPLGHAPRTMMVRRVTQSDSPWASYGLVGGGVWSPAPDASDASASITGTLLVGVIVAEEPIDADLRRLSYLALRRRSHRL